MKILAILLATAILSACGTTSKFGDRATKADRKKYVEVKTAIRKAPDWMTELPQDENAVYANATATSFDMNMADKKAMTLALGKICLAAGGTIDERSRIYMQDTENSTVETSELAIQSKCENVDITGAEIADIERVPSGSKFRTYVLVALPIGSANQLALKKQIREEQSNARERMEEVFEEMESN